MIKNYVLRGNQLSSIDKFTNDILDKSLKFIKSHESKENAKQGRLEAGSTCAKNTGAEGASTVNKAPNAK
jgi:hypothetical protein